MFALRKFYWALITGGVILSVGSSALADSAAESNRPTQNDQLHSLSAPSSDSPSDQTERRDVTEGNLSSPPPIDPSTNNAPFEEKEINSSPDRQKKPD